MTEITYQLTEDDYWEAYRLWRGKSGWGRFKVGYVLVLGLLVPVIIFGNGFWKVWLSDWTLLAMACVPLAIVIWVWVMVLYVLPKRGVKRLMQMPGSLAPIQFRWDAEGVGFTTKVSESRLNWELVQRWWESDKVFVLSTGSRGMSPVPKRAMTEAQVEELRGLLRERVRE